MAIVTVREKLTSIVQQGVHSLYTSGYLEGEAPTIALEPPKQAVHGDYACTIALALARTAKKNPREIAQKLQAAIGEGGGMIERSEIAGPGFLNFFVSADMWRESLRDILEQGTDLLRSNVGQGEKILLEYVSANPTGPLHIAHGRGAVIGDVLARLLRAVGYDVLCEYYVNDQGNQTNVMARSIFIRYQELYGREMDHPEDFYPGEYVSEIATELREEVGDRFVDQPEEAWLDTFRDRGIELMRARIQADLEAFGVPFDSWVSERELTERLDLDGMIQRLETKGHIYTEEGKRWFRTTDFGDDKDRVVQRDDGRTTYFASDIAYHDDKVHRGYRRLINLWGADHGGYITRVKAGMQALDHDPEALEVLLMQMVSLSRGGETVRMGKRLGTAVWLQDVVAEAGRDATRYFFLMRRSDSQMDFDLDLAASKSLDNPVYYAQMGHARMCAIGRKAREAGYNEVTWEPGALDALQLPEELGLIKAMLKAPEVIRDAAHHREPHQVVHYIQDLIAQFHSYYTQYGKTERVISDDPDKTRARLLLCKALQTSLKGLLELLGVDAPEEMYLEPKTT